MKKLPGIITIITLFILSCNNAPVNEAKEEAKDTIPARPQLEPQADLQVEQVDSTIRFQSREGVDLFAGKGHLEKKGDPVIVHIDLGKGDRITGKVIPEKEGANIRFSHIYMPDGSSDGPFGQTIEYVAKQKGNYRLYISPNRMAGDPESTGFSVTINVKKP